MPGVSRSEIQVKVIDESLIVFGKINYDEDSEQRIIFLMKMNSGIISENLKSLIQLIKQKSVQNMITDS